MILKELEKRGLIQDFTDQAGINALPKGTSFYVGFDPTAASLQIGNLVPLLVAMHLGRAGFTPYILFGGATGAIGDPSGRSTERPLLTREAIDDNVSRISKKVTEIFARAKVKANFVNNHDWTKDVSVIDFLRDVGKHFPLAYMIAKETVKTRLHSEGISFTEFSYMLLQSFDFYHLYKNNNCKLQIGASDQWGNITAGLELIRRKDGGEAHGFSFPLITDSQGKKLGKSTGGTLWLNQEMTSPFKFHQYWLNISDDTVGKYLKIFTFLSIDEIDQILADSVKSPEKRLAHHRLADEVTALVHGAEAVMDAKNSARILFGGEIKNIPEAKLEEIFADVPSSAIDKNTYQRATLLDLFIFAGLAKSKTEARRLFTDGGAYINNERAADGGLTVSGSIYHDAGLLVLRAGKKNHSLLKIQ